MTPSDLQAVLASQYKNSPVLSGLVQDISDWLDPRVDFQAFYDSVWNVNTATGWGLDVWGRIVGVTRAFIYNAVNYTLGDDDFRTLILVKALANICNSSVPSYNRLLSNLFAGLGRIFVRDNHNMTMSIIAQFSLTPTQIAILAGSGAFPHPGGVGTDLIISPPKKTFGFKGSGMQPFNQGTFFQRVTM